MAYVDFTSDPVLAAGSYAVVAGRAVSATPAELTALEWSVVTLARRDRMGSLKRRGLLSAVLSAVFGLRRASPQLADPRLEALRRMAVLSWHRGFAVPVAELKAFLRAGFSTAQYETMLASISAARSRLESRA